MKGSRSLLTNLLVFLVMLFFLIDIHASDSQQKLHIVTTVAPITNIVQNIVGSDEHVIGIVPNGVDSHTFEPVPTDAKLLANADIIFVNGLDLEIPTLKLAEKVKNASTPIVHLGNRTLQKTEWRYDFSFPRELGHPNPHLWTNIAYVMRYAEIIRDNLITLNPQRQDAYAANTAAYQIRLKQLDDAIFDCVKSIPKNNRKLVTYHDSFAYFAPRYGMEVIAAVQPSNFSEPGPREVIRVIKQIRHEVIPAIFG
nr:zinc ABC transporter substrate-binding protein [Nitrosomonas sp.]